jgi:predicted phage terminase large subunit-like protein
MSSKPSSAVDLLAKNPKIARQRISRQRQLRSHRAFVDYQFPTIEDAAFEWGPHHEVICRTLDRVFAGEITRLIVNIPPGYTKTLLCTTMFAARGFAINPNARFLHTSASNPLVLMNSKQVRDIMAAERYQALFPCRMDQQAGSRWSLAEGGQFFALPGKGTITGMRAGRKPDYPGQFTGALLIDDPQKAQDADKKVHTPSGAELRAVNDRYHSTLKSRLFPTATTPVIVVQQRLHMDDLSGHLLTGGSNEKWHHLCLPVEIAPGWQYPPEWTHGIPIEHDLPPGPLWRFQHDEAQIDLLRYPESVFSAQYMQQPLEGEGLIFAAEHFSAWRDLPNLTYRAIFADTAQKASETADWTVFQCWGKGTDGKAYLLDQLRMRLEAPELITQAKAFWKKHKAMDSTELGSLRAFKIEDKVSGTGLIQTLARDGIPVEPIPRAKDKVTRAHDVVACFASGLALHPDERTHPWVKGWRAEMLAFPQGAYDDQCDPTFDAVAEMCSGPKDFFDAL